jgi:hypothetical protein
MRRIIFILLIPGLFACNHQADSTQLLQNRIDSLEYKLADTYKPGFGEFMSGIQAHHSKLWFAGQSYNWQLADFEVHEIMEAIADIQKYQAERKESQVIQIINPALDSMNMAIQQRNPALFDKSFIFLTNTCNNCHRATNFEFNQVKIPDTQQFSNQEFKIKKDVQ